MKRFLVVLVVVVSFGCTQHELASGPINQFACEIARRSDYYGRFHVDELSTARQTFYRSARVSLLSPIIATPQNANANPFDSVSALRRGVPGDRIDVEIAVDAIGVKQGEDVHLFLRFEKDSGTLRDSYAQGIFRRNSFGLLENAGLYGGYAGLTDDALLAHANRGFAIPNDERSVCHEPLPQSAGGGSAPLLTSGGPGGGGP